MYLSWCRISSIHSISRLVRHSRKEQSLGHVHPLYTCSSLTKVVGFLKAGNGANGCKRPTLSFAWAGVRMHSQSCELFCILVGAARFPNVVLDFDPTKGCSPDYLKLKVVTNWVGCGIAAGQPRLLKFGPAYNNGRIQRSNNTETFQRCIGCGHGEEQRSISDGHFPY